jgi:hypothetical protein
VRTPISASRATPVTHATPVTLHKTAGHRPTRRPFRNLEGNTPTLHRQLRALPWKDVPGHSVTDTSHGRRVRRTIKVVTAPDWIEFPGAAQVAQLRRTLTRKG